MTEAASSNPTWTLHGQAYDFSSFAKTHPGGPAGVLVWAGKDATEAFDAFHSWDAAHQAAMWPYIVPPARAGGANH
jgi:cytochrome b involved in lipid metabolism